MGFFLEPQDQRKYSLQVNGWESYVFKKFDHHYNMIQFILE
jgi:hypothetical protein